MDVYSGSMKSSMITMVSNGYIQTAINRKKRKKERRGRKEGRQTNPPNPGAFLVLHYQMLWERQTVYKQEII